MRFRSRRTLATGVACAFYITFAAAAASAQPYNFLKIADTSGPFSNFGEPALNDAGTVAFWGVSHNTGGSGPSPSRRPKPPRKCRKIPIVFNLHRLY